MCRLHSKKFGKANSLSSFPDEVTITDMADDGSPEGTNTPAGEPSDDFFSSWDKPAIKRPSNPPSRTGTPAGASRTASPFLNAGANGNGNTRSKSPLNLSSPAEPSADSSETSKPAASRAISSSAMRKTTATQPRKTNVLGAKKKGLGAKKIGGDVGAAAIDFDEAERKAREEAERIEKLGYDPDAEAAEVATPSSPVAASSGDSKIVSPKPLSPGRSFSGGHQRSSSEIERLGMGIGRLGFGQVGAQKAAAVPKKPGFGAISRPAPVDGMFEIILILIVTNPQSSRR